MMLCRNDVFTDLTKSRRARLLHANVSTDEAVTFDMSAPDGLPIIESLSLRIKGERLGTLIIERGQLTPLNDKRASAKSQARRDTAWARIEPLVSQVEIYSKETRYALIEERARRVKCSVVTLLKDLRRYWVGGQTKAALLGKFHRCGHKSSTHETSAGRKPHLADYIIFRVKPNDEANMKEAIDRTYLKADGLTAATVTDAYQRLLESHYSYNDGNGKRIIKELGDRPTLRQFYSFLYKHYSIETITRRRKSDSEFERNHAAKIGSIQQDCLGVGHIYEIDATIADVFLVASKDRSRIIGKPTLYLVIDRRSRLIVGFYVGLEAPSWPAAMHAILSISENKASLCGRYNVPYAAEDWPADAVYPGMFLADRGEILSRDSSLVVNGLQITIGNLPKQRPDYKPLVECGFKLMHREMVDSVPGYEPPENVFKRQAKRFDKDASLTLDEFISIIIKIIITHNRTAMPNFPLSIDSMSRGIRAIPREIWNDEAPRRMGSLTRFDEEYVRFSLLPADKAVITRGGIQFNGCFYSAPVAVESGWFVRAGNGTKSIDISYDRRLVDSIYLHDDKDPTKFYVAHLLEKSAEYRGLSFAEVQAYESLKRRLQPEYEQIRRQERSDFHAHADPIAKHARHQTKLASKGKSRSARKADIVGDRTDERRVRRQEEAAMPSVSASQPTKATVISFMPPRANAGATDLAFAETSLRNESADGQPVKQLTLAEKLKLKRMEMQNGKS
jgi:putative transposase